ncbi:MAG: hypothetical protein H7Z19_09645 [Chitinophagaceae bacterium]|nr:hypothetical protein [Rubrivivax sp.]
MPTDISAKLQNVLLRKLVSEITQRVSRTRPAMRQADDANNPPMLYRSEGFAEDLSESHPLN